MPRRIVFRFDRFLVRTPEPRRWNGLHIKWLDSVRELEALAWSDDKLKWAIHFRSSSGKVCECTTDQIKRDWLNHKMVVEVFHIRILTYIHPAAKLMVFSSFKTHRSISIALSHEWNIRTKTARSEEGEHRKVCCDSGEPKGLLCYFMRNERRIVLLRAKDEFKICLKKTH